MEECKQALASLGLDQDGHISTVNDTSIPGGCSWASSPWGYQGAQWNQLEPGNAGHDVQMAVCRACSSFTTSGSCTEASCLWTSDGEEEMCRDCSYWTEEECDGQSGVAPPLCAWSRTSYTCEAQYYVTEGSSDDLHCTGVGLWGIESKEACEEAAVALDLSDQKAGNITHAIAVPYGCVWKEKADGTFRLKWEDEYDGDASDRYSLICATAGAAGLDRRLDAKRGQPSWTAGWFAGFLHI